MSRITTCPHCSRGLNLPEGITDKTSICPHCQADMNNPRPVFQVQPADINTNVKRGLRVESIVLAVLIGFCLLGIASAYSAPRGGPSGLERALKLALLFGALDILVAIVIARSLIRWGSSGFRNASEGRVLGIALLTLGSIIAVIVFFFFTCGFLVG